MLLAALLPRELIRDLRNEKTSSLGPRHFHSGARSDFRHFRASHEHAPYSTLSGPLQPQQGALPCSMPRWPPAVLAARTAAWP